VKRAPRPQRQRQIGDKIVDILRSNRTLARAEADTKSMEAKAPIALMQIARASDGDGISLDKFDQMV